VVKEEDHIIFGGRNNVDFSFRFYLVRKNYKKIKAPKDRKNKKEENMIDLSIYGFY
jgi:hypothetical protein